MSSSESHADRISRLANLFPQLDPAVVSTVVASVHPYEEATVYSSLYKLSSSAAPHTPPPVPPDSPSPSSTPPPPSSAASADTALDLSVFVEEFSRMESADDAALAAQLQADEQAAAAGVAEASHGRGRGRGRGRGSWATPHGAQAGAQKRKPTFTEVECFKALQDKYPWAETALLKSVCEAAAGDRKLAEELLLESQPDVANIANVGAGNAIDNGVGNGVGNGHGRRNGRPRGRGRARGARAGSGRTSVVAEEMRRRDVREMAAESAGRGAGESLESRIQRLKVELSRAMTERDNEQALYLQTQQKRHKECARRYRDTVDRVWAELKEALSQTEQFRTGTVDLHHLNSEMAIEMVDLKLERMAAGERAVFITGRGNNSLGGRGVLLPRVMKHLTDRGITCSKGRSGGCVNARR